MAEILITGGPHDGTEMEVPYRTEFVGKFTPDMKVHGYRATRQKSEGRTVFEYIGPVVAAWDEVELGESGGWTVDFT